MSLDIQIIQPAIEQERVQVRCLILEENLSEKLLRLELSISSLEFSTTTETCTNPPPSSSSQKKHKEER